MSKKGANGSERSEVAAAMRELGEHLHPFGFSLQRLEKLTADEVARRGLVPCDEKNGGLILSVGDAPGVRSEFIMDPSPRPPENAVGYLEGTPLVRGLERYTPYALYREPDKKP